MAREIPDRETIRWMIENGLVPDDVLDEFRYADVPSNVDYLHQTNYSCDGGTYHTVA